MRRQPPAWLHRWSFLTSALLGFARNLILRMLQATKLKIFPREWLAEAVPPRVESKTPVKNCPHTNVKRYGNAHGRFAQCTECGVRMKWNPESEVWAYKPSQASSRSLPLPPPSLSNTVTSVPKSKARPKRSTRSSAASGSSRTTTSNPRHYNISDQPTPSTEGYLDCLE